MIPLYDLHTHCTFCDGKDTPERMVLSAIEKGFKCIGFSSHAFTDFDTSYCMPQDSEEEYKKAILALRQKYEGQIEICLGCEQEYYSKHSAKGYDYVIGSVHYLHPQGAYLPVDLSAEALKSGVKEFYGGDFYAAAADYYRAVADLKNKTDCDIIGHFDLITKYNEGGAQFDESDKRYVSAALSAVEALLKSDPFFEINTGAVTRALRTAPYPADFILKYIAEKKGRIVLSGDTHAAENLGREWEKAKAAAVACGFKTAWLLQNGEFKEYSIF